MRPSTACGDNTPNVTPTNYSPAVPISVYRELAAQLQAKEALIDSLNARNQHLTQQNQQLRQEIEKAVQSILELRQFANATIAVTRTYAKDSTFDHSSHPMQRNYAPPSKVQSMRTGSVFSGKLFTQQEVGRYRRRSQPGSAKEINGWWLAIAIVLIVVTAFGAGYLIVRPLLAKH